MLRDTTSFTQALYITRYQGQLRHWLINTGFVWEIYALFKFVLLRSIRGFGRGAISSPFHQVFARSPEDSNVSAELMTSGLTQAQLHQD